MNQIAKVNGGCKEVFTHPSRSNIKALESLLVSLPEDMRAEQPLVHRFADGIYSREILLYKGTITSSKIHKIKHFSLILEGDVTIATPDGTVQRVQGPHLFITEPNTKRMIIVHEDTRWITFHVTDKTDLSEIEKDIISEDYV